MNMKGKVVSMALIRANCSLCGPVNVDTRQAELRICDDTNEATLGFSCGCSVYVLISLTEALVEVFRCLSITEIHWRLPEISTDEHAPKHATVLATCHNCGQIQVSACEVMVIDDKHCIIPCVTCGGSFNVTVTSQNRTQLLQHGAMAA